MSWRQQYIEQAREDLLERLLQGKKIAGAHGGFIDLVGLIECEFDASPRATADEVGSLLVSIIAFARDEHVHGERRARVEQYLKPIAEKYLAAHPDLVQQRAAEIMHADAEAA